jgi:hypothetical protein
MQGSASRARRLATALALGTIGLASPSSAAPDESASVPEAEPGALEPDLQVRLRFSGFAAGWAGDVAAHGASAHVGADLDEAFELENFGAGAEAEVRWRRFLVVAGGSWADLDDELETPGLGARFGPLQIAFPTIPFGGPAGLRVPEILLRLPPGKVDVEVEEATGDLQLGYRLLSAPVSDLLGAPRKGDRRRIDVDLMAGVRYWDLESRIDVSIPAAAVAPVFVTPLFLVLVPAPFPILEERLVEGARFQASDSLVDELRELLPDTIQSVDFDGLELTDVRFSGVRRRYEADAHWLDPVIGVRIGVDVTDCLRVRLRGDVGGFDLGSAADLSWSAEAGLVLRLATHVEAELSYFGLGVERDRGDGAVDFVQHGPRLGVTFVF